MTNNLPSAPTLGYAQPPVIERPSPNGTAVILCWVIILAIVGLEIASNLYRAGVAADTSTDNATMSAIGHCIVGAHVLAASGKTAGDKISSADATAPLVEEMLTVARSPTDRLRAAIVSKEVGSNATAATLLDGMAKSRDLSATVQSDLNVVRIIYHDGPAAITASQRESLTNHEGWFGELALSYGLSDSTPTRSKVLQQARRAFLASTTAVAVGGGGLLLGFGMIVLAIVLAATGRLPLWFSRPQFDSIFLEAFALYLAGFVVLSLLLHVLVHSPGLGWTLVLTVMLPAALLWPVVRGKPWAQTRMEFGWHVGKGIFREIACGLIGYLAALPLLADMLFITLQLIRVSGTNPSHPVVGYLSGGPSEIVLIYFIACIWAPVFEESMFRGALFNHLRARHGWWISAGIVGLLFAAVHPQGWTTIPVLGGIGMVLCALREWRGSLIASMSAHALSNGMVITLALLTSR